MNYIIKLIKIDYLNIKSEILLDQFYDVSFIKILFFWLYRS